MRYHAKRKRVEGSKAGVYCNLRPRQPRCKRTQGKIARIRRCLGAAVAVQDWIGLDTNEYSPAGTRRRWVPFHSTAQRCKCKCCSMGRGLVYSCRGLETGYAQYETRTRQDKTRQDGSMDVDAEPKPSPGGELVLGAYCADAGIKVKIQPFDGHARNEI
ncbi:hypothetical protein B0H14DRAFT_3746944 [Mycena olivaceomarginata]|nr:hypothetical protein B0H14DRAFT_3746944 [Mycena olivaceomarginata]